ncbi:neuronal acetylcholine receptor subunit alpha-10-like isoform X2 [Anneissia japonica]|nr:neuronal acetylcholine receptor subunit alpha-10-like isoform X2 [Anneissia japonica]
MSNYTRTTVRPVILYKDAVNVKLRMILTQVIELNERIQKMTISSWYRLTWTDEYLTWNPGEYNNITSVMIDKHYVWCPDITLYNSIDDEFEHIKDSLKLIVSYDGSVVFSSPAIFHTFCKINVRLFPLDVQHCELVFGTWMYDRAQEDLYPDTSPQSVQTEYHENGIWKLVKVVTEREERKYNCCPETYAFVKYTVIIKRRERFFVEIILLPCSLLSFLTMFVFLLPPESGEKTSFGVTTLLAILLFQQLIAQTLPPSADSTPIIQSYFTSLMCMSSCSVVATAFVMNIYNRRQPSRVPPWLRSLLLSKVGRTIGRNHQKTGYFKSVLTPSEAKINEGGIYLNRTKNKHELTESTDRETGRPSSLIQQKIGCRELSKILEELREIKKDRETSKIKEKYENEWREVAVLIDRILLFITLIIALTAFLTVIGLITTHPYVAAYDSYM